MHRQIRDKLRREFQKMYRCADDAFAALDFSGKGHIDEDNFFNNLVVRTRVAYSKQHIKEFLNQSSLFTATQPGITFDVFKKNFFPHHYLV